MGLMGWFAKRAQARPPLAAEEPAPAPTSNETQRESSGLSPEDRARLSGEGTPTDEVAWIDAWLRDQPGRTLEDLAQQEARFVAVLRSYRTLMDEITNSGTTGSIPPDRLKEARETATASLAHIDQAVLMRGFAEISANETMQPVYKNLSLGLIKTVLEGRARSSVDRHNRSA